MQKNRYRNCKKKILSQYVGESIFSPTPTQRRDSDSHRQTEGKQVSQPVQWEGNKHI